jgi:hypothetical protein
MIIIQFPDRNGIGTILFYFDVGHVMGSKEADDCLQDVLLVNLVLSCVCYVKKLAHLKFLRDRSAKSEGIHVWHLIIVPINIQTHQMRKWCLNVMS